MWLYIPTALQGNKLHVMSRLSEEPFLSIPDITSSQKRTPGEVKWGRCAGHLLLLDSRLPFWRPDRIGRRQPMLIHSTLLSFVLSTAIGVPAVAEEPASLAADCIIMNSRNFDSRQSPLDSLSFEVGGGIVKICYGRPSARGRTMIGGDAVPYGALWRTGANEPTMIHTSVSINVAGVDVEPGTYALYTVPTEGDWEIIVNRSITQWGRENRYTDEVKAQEVSRGTAPSEQMDDHVETFTMRAEQSDGGVTLFLEWEHTRVRVPVSAKN